MDADEKSIPLDDEIKSEIEIIIYINRFSLLNDILDAQLSSRCLSIDSPSSKCWLILTYPKQHEPSLDIW